MAWGAAPAASGLDASVLASLQPFLTGTPGQNSPAMDAAIAAFNSGTLPLIQQQLQLQGLGQSPMVASVAAGALGQNLVPLIQGDYANRLAAAQQAQNLYLGKGNLDIAGRSQTLAEQMQPADLALRGELGRGQLEQARYGTDVQRELGLGQNANTRYGTDVQRELGLGNLGLGYGQLDQAGTIAGANIAQQEAQRQLQAYGMAGNMFLGLAQPYSAAQSGQQAQQQTALTGYSQAGQAQQQVGQNTLDARQMEMLRLMGLSEAGTTGLFGGSVLPPSMTQGGTSSTTGGGK